MKLFVLFMGLCLSVAVLCSAPYQVEVGLTNSRHIGDLLASSNNQTSIRTKRGRVRVREVLARLNGRVNSFYAAFNDKSKLCHREPNRPRRQRNPNNFICPPPVTTTPAQNFYNYIELIAADLRNSAETITTDVSNDNRHAVNHFTTITAPANQNHAQPIDLTVTMQATLTYDIAAQNRRAPIHYSIAERMQQMDWYRGGNRNTNDEQGHLLADSLGGPSFAWNFVPQSPSVNRAVSIAGDFNVVYCWFDLEAEIRDILRENQDHYITWTILISYGGLPTSRRPTAFLISVRLMTSNHQFVYYRTFMIPNVPSDACTNTNHAYWQNGI
nr:uncharacterized protein LOC108131517 [Drosophila bipectinata]